MDFWKVPRDWGGATAFIVASGPSINDLDSSRLRGQRVIVVNTSFQICPFADYLFAMDTRWLRINTDAIKKFSGTIVTVSNTFKMVGLKRLKKAPPPGLSHKRNCVTGRRTSVQGAINLAVHLGVARIILVGVDCQPSKEGETHWHKPHKWPQKEDCFDAQYDDLKSTVTPLEKLGIEVINVSPYSRIDFWPQKTLDDILPSAVQIGDRPNEELNMDRL
jgi:hypothetical protein